MANNTDRPLVTVTDQHLQHFQLGVPVVVTLAKRHYLWPCSTHAIYVHVHQNGRHLLRQSWKTGYEFMSVMKVVNKADIARSQLSHGFNDRDLILRFTKPSAMIVKPAAAAEHICCAQLELEFLT